MADTLDKNRKWWERIQDSYKISIVNEENLEELNHFNLSLIKLYIGVSIMGLIISSLVIAFIVYTPVKRLIPGYGDINSNSDFKELTRKVVDLEKEVESYEVYTNGLKNLLTGNSPNEQNLNPNTKIEATKFLNHEDISETNQTLKLNFLKFATPVVGNVSAGFNPKIQHFGVDVVASKDTPIKAIHDGVIVSADESIASGKNVFIQHENNLISVYRHNSALLVKTGDVVKTGQAIAIIGNTGSMTTGPHLHFEMWFEGKYINPQKYISF